MRKALLLALLATGCASTVTPPPWYGKAKPVREVRSAFEIAYTCSHNARLTERFIADLNSKSLSEIRFFLVSTQAAWSETAAALRSDS